MSQLPAPAAQASTSQSPQQDPPLAPPPPGTSAAKKKKNKKKKKKNAASAAPTVASSAPEEAQTDNGPSSPSPEEPVELAPTPEVPATVDSPAITRSEELEPQTVTAAVASPAANDDPADRPPYSVTEPVVEPVSELAPSDTPAPEALLLPADQEQPDFGAHGTAGAGFQPMPGLPAPMPPHASEMFVDEAEDMSFLLSSNTADNVFEAPDKLTDAPQAGEESNLVRPVPESFIDDNLAEGAFESPAQTERVVTAAGDLHSMETSNEVSFAPPAATASSVSQDHGVDAGILGDDVVTNTATPPVATSSDTATQLPETVMKPEIATEEPTPVVTSSATHVPETPDNSQHLPATIEPQGALATHKVAETASREVEKPTRLEEFHMTPPVPATFTDSGPAPDREVEKPTRLEEFHIDSNYFGNNGATGDTTGFSDTPAHVGSAAGLFADSGDSQAFDITPVEDTMDNGVYMPKSLPLATQALFAPDSEVAALGSDTADVAIDMVGTDHAKQFNTDLQTWDETQPQPVSAAALFADDAEGMAFDIPAVREDTNNIVQGHGTFQGTTSAAALFADDAEEIAFEIPNQDDARQPDSWTNVQEADVRSTAPVSSASALFNDTPSAAPVSSASAWFDDSSSTFDIQATPSIENSQDVTTAQALFGDEVESAPFDVSVDHDVTEVHEVTSSRVADVGVSIAALPKEVPRSAAALFAVDAEDLAFDIGSQEPVPLPNEVLPEQQRAPVVGEATLDTMFESSPGDWLVDTSQDDSIDLGRSLEHNLEHNLEHDEPLTYPTGEDVELESNAYDQVPEGWYDESGNWNWYTAEEREAVRQSMFGYSAGATEEPVSHENEARRTPLPPTEETPVPSAPETDPYAPQQPAVQAPSQQPSNMYAPSTQQRDLYNPVASQTPSQYVPASSGYFAYQPQAAPTTYTPAASQPGALYTPGFAQQQTTPFAPVPQSSPYAPATSPYAPQQQQQASTTAYDPYAPTTTPASLPYAPMAPAAPAPAAAPVAKEVKKPEPPKRMASTAYDPPFLASSKVSKPPARAAAAMVPSLDSFVPPAAHAPPPAAAKPPPGPPKRTKTSERVPSVSTPPRPPSAKLVAPLAPQEQVAVVSPPPQVSQMPVQASPTKPQQALPPRSPPTAADPYMPSPYAPAPAAAPTQRAADPYAQAPATPPTQHVVDPYAPVAPVSTPLTTLDPYAVTPSQQEHVPPSSPPKRSASVSAAPSKPKYDSFDPPLRQTLSRPSSRHSARAPNFAAPPTSHPGQNVHQSAAVPPVPRIPSPYKTSSGNQQSPAFSPPPSKAPLFSPPPSASAAPPRTAQPPPPRTHSPKFERPPPPAAAAPPMARVPSSNKSGPTFGAGGYAPPRATSPGTIGVGVPPSPSAAPSTLPPRRRSSTHAPPRVSSPLRHQTTMASFASIHPEPEQEPAENSHVTQRDDMAPALMPVTAHAVVEDDFDPEGGSSAQWGEDDEEDYYGRAPHPAPPQTHSDTHVYGQPERSHEASLPAPSHIGYEPEQQDSRLAEPDSVQDSFKGLSDTYAPQAEETHGQGPYNPYASTQTRPQADEQPSPYAAPQTSSQSHTQTQLQGGYDAYQSQGATVGSKAPADDYSPYSPTSAKVQAPVDYNPYAPTSPKTQTTAEYNPYESSSPKTQARTEYNPYSPTSPKKDTAGYTPPTAKDPHPSSAPKPAPYNPYAPGHSPQQSTSNPYAPSSNPYAPSSPKTMTTAAVPSNPYAPSSNAYAPSSPKTTTSGAGQSNPYAPSSPTKTLGPSNAYTPSNDYNPYAPSQGHARNTSFGSTKSHTSAGAAAVGLGVTAAAAGTYGMSNASQAGSAYTPYGASSADYNPYAPKTGPSQAVGAPLAPAAQGSLYVPHDTPDGFSTVDPYGRGTSPIATFGSTQATSYFPNMPAPGPADPTYVPQQVLEQRPVSEDPLGRCGPAARNVPIAIFGFGGNLITGFPGAEEDDGQAPVYGYASHRQRLTIRPVSSVAEASSLGTNGTAEFPGPLVLDSSTPKGAAGDKKKRESVLTYLTTRADEIERGLPYLKSSANTKRREEEAKLVIMRLLVALIKGDGRLFGSPEAEEGVRAALQPLTDNSLSSNSFLSSHTHESATPAQLARIKSLLNSGSQRDAALYAASVHLWSHALIIASSVGPELWRELVTRYTTAELDDVPGTAGLKAAYTIFGGVVTDASGLPGSAPSSAPPTATGAHFGLHGPSSDTPTELTADQLFAASHLDDPSTDEWREVIGAVVFNAKATDLVCLEDLGSRFKKAGFWNAAQVCYLLTPNSPFNDMSPAAGDRNVMLVSGAADDDSVVFAEIAEYARSLVPTPKGTEAPQPSLPQLLPYKLLRAWRAAELGKVDEARKYCDAIETATKPTKHGISPRLPQHISASMDDLMERLSGSPSISGATGGLGLRKAKSTATIGSWIEGRLTKFIAGEDEGAEAVKPSPGPEKIGADNVPVGPFSHFSTISPAASGNVSRTPSGVDVAGAHGHGAVPATSPYLQEPPHVKQLGAAAPPTSAYSGYSPWGADPNDGDEAETPTTASTLPAVPTVNLGDDGDSGEFINPMGGDFINPMGGLVFGASAGSTDDYKPDSKPKAPAYAEADDEDLGFGNSSLSRGRTPRAAEPEEDENGQDAYAPPAAKGDKEDKAKPKAAPEPKATAKDAGKESKGWFGGWFKKKDAAEGGGPIRAKLGDDNAMVYDPDLKKWVMPGKKAAETHKAPPPPPRAQTASPNHTPRESLASRAAASASATPPPPVPPMPTGNGLPPGRMQRQSSLVPPGASSAATPGTRASTLPPSGGPPGPPVPPSTGRPPSSGTRSGAATPSLDDLLTRPPSSRPGSTAARKKRAHNKYVDVFQGGGE